MKKSRKGIALLVLVIFITEIFLSSMTSYSAVDPSGPAIVGNVSGIAFTANTQYNITGYITTEAGTKDGFKVEIDGTDISASTDSQGYYNLSFTPSSSLSSKISITKEGYLKREINNISVSNNTIIGPKSAPMVLWIGDMPTGGKQDGAINFKDIMYIAKCFNTKSTDSNYSIICDLNKDGAINMTDIMLIARHFNSATSTYPVVDIQSNSLPQALIDSAVNEIRPELKYWIIVKDQVSLNKYYLIKSSNELFVRFDSRVSKPGFFKPGDLFFSGYKCKSASMCTSNSTCTGWQAPEYTIEENSSTHYYPNGSAIWSNYDVRFENPFNGFVVYPATEKDKLPPAHITRPSPPPQIETTVPSALLSGASSIYPEYKYTIILKFRNDNLFYLIKSNNELFLVSWDGVNDPTIAKHTSELFNYNASIVTAISNAKNDAWLAPYSTNNDPNSYVGIGPNGPIAWCNYDIKFGNPEINEVSIVDIEELLKQINKGELVNVKEFIEKYMGYPELVNNLYFDEENILKTIYSGNTIRIKLNMKKYLNSYFARPFDIYNALGNYNTYKSGLSQGKVILYKGTEQITVDESEVPGYLDKGWSQKPPADARKILQFMPDYTIRFADSNRVWRLYGNEADAINTYLLKWCNNPDLPYADKYKLMINNILMYNKNTNFSFEELKALYILDNEGFKDYVTGKPMAFLDMLYYNIYGIFPKHYRHYNEKWNEIPLGEGIDYNFVEGDVASDSQLVFLGQLPGVADLEVLAKIALEVEVMVITNYAFEAAALLYLGRAVYGEAIAIDLYRAGRLKTAMNFTKTFSGAVSSFEYIDDVGKSLDDVDNVLNYEVQIVNAEGKVITKTMAECITKIKKAIKTNIDDLKNVITKVFNRVDDTLEVEYAGVGRVRFDDAALLDEIDADIICQQRYKNYLEATWSETADGLDDAAEALMNGQQYMKNGRIKALKPDVSYTSKGYDYSTDSLGRITKAEGDLIPNEAPRNPYAQRQAGRIDRLSTDDGGHLIGTQFNGSGELDNLVPMNSQINRSGGKWYQMEVRWKEALEAGKTVSVKIEPVYSGVSQRPVSFTIRYKIGDKDWVIEKILNQSGG